MQNLRQRRTISLLLAVLLTVGVAPAAYAAIDARLPPQQNKVFEPGVFVVKDGRYAAANNDTALYSQEAAGLRATFDRYYANDLVGIWITEQTAKIALMPAPGVALQLAAYDQAANSYAVLPQTQTDPNGFCIFAIPPGAAYPLRLIASNGALVPGSKPTTVASRWPPFFGSDYDTADEIDTEIMAYEIIDLANDEREKRNMDELAVSDDLMAYAAIRAQEIVTEFSHNRPDGTRAIDYILSSDEWSGAGENIAAGCWTAADFVRGWINSEGHRANILHRDREYTGVGVALGADGRLYAVQVFGRAQDW